MTTQGKPITATAMADSASGQTPPAWQQRDSRLTSILLAGRIITQSGDHLCRVRNISPGGMLIECETALTIGEAVRIELRNLNVVTARVRWTRDGRAGVQFDAPVEVANVLQKLEGTRFRPRAPRLDASCPVTLWHSGSTYRATLIDVSQTGCRLEITETLDAAADVRITIPNLPPRHAVLRWTRTGVCGFSFNEPLAFTELMKWNKGRSG